MDELMKGGWGRKLRSRVLQHVCNLGLHFSHLVLDSLLSGSTQACPAYGQTSSTTGG